MVCGWLGAQMRAGIWGNNCFVTMLTWPRFDLLRFLPRRANEVAGVQQHRVGCRVRMAPQDWYSRSMIPLRPGAVRKTYRFESPYA